MKTIFSMIVLFFTFIISGLQCSNQPVQVADGGGTETVIGFIVFENGSNGSGTEVKLIPTSYNPIRDGKLPDSLITTTDNNGRYLFSPIAPGVYNILATNTEDQVQLFYPRVSVKEKDTVIVPENVLKDPGAVKIVMPDTVDINNGSIFIQGTDIYCRMADAGTVANGLYTLVIDDIPAATFTKLNYTDQNTVNNPVQLIKDFTVSSRDTVLIEVYDYSVVTGSVIFENGVFASGTYVSIVPANYIPLKDDPLPGYMTDTTGVHGEFIFKLTQQGVYNIQAVHSENGVYLFRSDVTVRADTVILSTAELTEPGTVKLLVPDTVNFTEGSIVVEGSTFYTSLSQSTWLDTGFHVFYFDSLPAAIHSAMYYVVEKETPEKAVDAVTVVSGGITQKEAFVNWYHYTTRNSGLPSDHVLDMAIEPNGTMWFGTDAGAVEFDGSSWTVYNENHSGLLSDTVMSVTVNTDGVKWFGTTHGVAKYDGVTWETFTEGSSELPNDSVFEVTTDGSGTIWIGTDYGAASYDDNGTWNVYTPDNSPFPNTPGGEEVYCIAVDQGGVVWLGTDGGGLIAIDGNDWTVYTESNSSLSSKAIFSLYVDDQNNKWVGTFEGVAFYNNVSWSFYHVGGHTYKYTVSSIAVDQDNIKWFGSYEGGRVFRYDGTRVVTYNANTSMISKEAYEMFAIGIDADNNKWVPTTKGGIYVFGPVD